MKLEVAILGEMAKIQVALVTEEVISMFILPLGLLAKIRKIVQIIKVKLEVLKEVPLLLVLVA